MFHREVDPCLSLLLSFFFGFFVVVDMGRPGLVCVRSRNLLR